MQYTTRLNLFSLIGFALLILVIQLKLANAEPTDEARESAKRHFEQGVELHDGGNYRAAQIEFRQAYQLAPNYLLLFNLGQEALELKEYVEAHNSFVQYLKEGGDRISKDRRLYTEREIARINKYLASITLVISNPGAEVSVDGIVVGVSPLVEPIQVSVGRRKIVVSLKGYSVWQRSIDVAGESQKQVEVELLSLTADVVPTYVPPAPTRSTTFWVSAATTGLFLAGTGAAVFFTDRAKSDYESEQNTVRDGSAEEKLRAIDDAGKKYKRFALYTDIGIGLSVAGIVTTILTSGKSSAKSESKQSSVRLLIAPTSVGLSAQF